MTPLKGMKNPEALIRTGLVFMILASLSSHFLPRVGAVSPDLADGLTGFFYGITIAALLLGLYRRQRRSG